MSTPEVLERLQLVVTTRVRSCKSHGASRDCLGMLERVGSGVPAWVQANASEFVVDFGKQLVAHNVIHLILREPQSS